MKPRIRDEGNRKATLRSIRQKSPNISTTSQKQCLFAKLLNWLILVVERLIQPFGHISNKRDPSRDGNSANQRHLSDRLGAAYQLRTLNLGSDFSQRNTGSEPNPRGFGGFGNQRRAPERGIAGNRGNASYLWDGGNRGNGSVSLSGFGSKERGKNKRAKREQPNTFRPDSDLRPYPTRRR